MARGKIEDSGGGGSSEGETGGGFQLRIGIAKLMTSLMNQMFFLFPG